MTAHVIPDWKGSWEIYARKIVDLLWNAAMFLTLAFGVGVMFIFAFGLAINLHIIDVPKQYCHYMDANQTMEEFCK
jgi:hypothetical protein